MPHCTRTRTLKGEQESSSQGFFQVVQARGAPSCPTPLPRVHAHFIQNTVHEPPFGHEKRSASPKGAGGQGEWPTDARRRRRKFGFRRSLRGGVRARGPCGAHFLKGKRAHHHTRRRTPTQQDNEGEKE